MLQFLNTVIQERTCLPKPIYFTAFLLSKYTLQAPLAKIEHYFPGCTWQLMTCHILCQVNVSLIRPMGSMRHEGGKRKHALRPTSTSQRVAESYASASLARYQRPGEKPFGKRRKVRSRS